MLTYRALYAIWGLSPLVLLTLGVIALWTVSAWRYARKTPAGSAYQLALSVIGWVLLLCGTLLGMSFLPPPLAMLAAIAVVLVLVNALVRYRRGEMQYLLWTISESARRGIPLKSAAAAFSLEGRGAASTRARSLADYLDAAMPLSLAMRRSRLRIQPEFRLAADVGEKSGTLPAMLHGAIEQALDRDELGQSTAAKIGYLGFVLAYTLSVVAFLLIKIVPTFQEMFHEFGLRLPGATQALIEGSRWLVEHLYVTIPLGMLLALPAVLAIVQYVGVPLRSLPLLGALWSSDDIATAMRLLAVAVREKRSLTGSLELLATCVPYRGTRTRLRTAIALIGQGNHWCDALARARLLSSGQHAVLRSAERAGNLSWALDEMADSMLRRSAHRARAALSILMPLLTLVVGSFVLFLAIAILLPLFSLIGALV